MAEIQQRFLQVIWRKSAKNKLQFTLTPLSKPRGIEASSAAVISSSVWLGLCGCVAACWDSQNIRQFYK
jgi:hypothetical protein